MTRRRGALAATRLESLDPDALGREVAAHVMAYAAELDALLGAHKRVARSRNEAALAATISTLVLYAQTGDKAEEALAALAAFDLFRTTPLGSVQDVEELDVQGDDFSLALVGAHAREKLAKNQAVTARDLATLASITTNSVHLFTRAGELVPINDGRPALYDARQARKWLGERGVPGLSRRG